jgi:hypothetical protein
MCRYSVYFQVIRFLSESWKATGLNVHDLKRVEIMFLCLLSVLFRFKGDPAAAEEEATPVERKDD